MKLMRIGISFVLFGVGLGMGAPDFATAQIMRPDRGRDGDQRPPDVDPRSRDVDPRSPDVDPRLRDVDSRSRDAGPRPPGIDPRSRDVEPPPPAATRRSPGITPPPPAAVNRAPVVTPPGWPLKRAPRPVVVRPPEGPPLVPPKQFLPAIVFGGAVVTLRNDRRYTDDRGFSRDSLVWQETETLYREDKWTEFTLDCNARGTKLWIEAREGRIQLDWVEVVFDNGEVQVVEFPERSLGRGIYKLLDFPEGRRVDYVRVVAQATSREAKLTLWMER